MKTYVCKSVKNAIKYFEQNSTSKVCKTIIIQSNLIFNY